MSAARQKMLSYPEIQALLSELSGWPGPPLKRHNDAGHLLHKLVFISDIGMRVGDPGINEIANNIIEHKSKDGPFQVIANVSPQYGGSGKDELAWMLCDSPSILYSIVKLGTRDDSVIQSAARHLATLSTGNGWPCTVSSNLGKFRGPGRKTDPCPYATLISSKAMSQIPEWHGSEVCLRGADSLLQLWEQRKERRPYLFAMGTDFQKLKAPMVWYDILHVLEVLTQFPHLLKDDRLLEMVDILKAKSDREGRFTAESVWKAWSGWEFGQKKAPSFWLTLQAHLPC
ncbi:hypothetical protein ACFLYF_06565 [Chloroflexota bacterium]